MSPKHCLMSAFILHRGGLVRTAWDTGQINIKDLPAYRTSLEHEELRYSDIRTHAAS